MTRYLWNKRAQNYKIYRVQVESSSQWRQQNLKGSKVNASMRRWHTRDFADGSGTYHSDAFTHFHFRKSGSGSSRKVENWQARLFCLPPSVHSLSSLCSLHPTLFLAISLLSLSLSIILSILFTSVLSPSFFQLSFSLSLSFATFLCLFCLSPSILPLFPISCFTLPPRSLYSLSPSLLSTLSISLHFPLSRPLKFGLSPSVLFCQYSLFFPILPLSSHPSLSPLFALSFLSVLSIRPFSLSLSLHLLSISVGKLAT